MRGSHAKTRPQALADWLALESADWSPFYPFPSDISPSLTGYFEDRSLSVPYAA